MLTFATASIDRNSQAISPGPVRTIAERLQLANDLRKDLLLGRLRLVYQPIVSLSSGRVTGTEALARWSHPVLGPIAPSEFIPLAEQAGLIRLLGWWVTREACRQLRAWQRLNPTLQDLTVSVNLSGLQLSKRGLTQDIAEILTETGVSPQSLQLEITETALVPDSEIALTNLNELKALGVKLAIDDFGMGYSSLSYLLQLPVDTIKLDRSFVSGVESDPRARALIKAIVGFARDTEQTIVAEGVETQAQLDWLRSEQCAQAQGYFLSRPLSANKTQELLLSKV